MALSFIRTFNFRNLANTDGVHFKGKEVFLVGKNGQGKTNFLEAIYYLSSGVSFRTRLKRDIIKKGEREAAIYGSFVGNTEFLPGNDVKIVIRNNLANVVEKNGKQIKNRLELFFEFPVVVFSHEDISLVKGPLDLRRSFFDRTISLFDRNYFDNLKSYYRVLKQKNALLKGGLKSKSLLDVYDNKLVLYGLSIMKGRRELIERFNDIFSTTLKAIADELSSLKIVYIPSWEGAVSSEDAKRRISDIRDREIALGFSLSGPHKDKFYFDINGRDFSRIASTGQLRLCSLALKSGQAQIVFEKGKKRSIILLDDVLLEIDGRRKLDFLSTLSNYEQSFFTFLPEEDFLSYRKDTTEIFYVENGGLSKWREREKS